MMPPIVKIVKEQNYLVHNRIHARGSQSEGQMGSSTILVVKFRLYYEPEKSIDPIKLTARKKRFDVEKLVQKRLEFGLVFFGCFGRGVELRETVYEQLVDIVPVALEDFWL